MPDFESEKKLQGNWPDVRLVQIGGRGREELREDLHAGSIQLNGLALALLASDKFQTELTPRRIRVVVVSVGELGFPGGEGMQAIQKQALARGLFLCPVELAPHFRLQWRDQPEGCTAYPATRQKAPPGSITVVSEPLAPDDDDFPKGFYLRCMESELWLRGYRSDDEHVWDAEDRLAFCQR